MSLPFSYTIRSNPRIKNIRISINSSGEVKVSKPWLIPKLIAEQFVKSHQQWIEEKITLIKTKQSNSHYLYLGILYDIVFTTNKFSYTFKNNKLYLNGPNKVLALKALEKDLIDISSKLIKQAVKVWSVKMGLSCGRITIRDQDSRWGSCSSQKNLNFSWRLIKAPKEVLDYVVIHELAHLKHMDHSQAFWQLVEQFNSSYREHRRWLRRNQSLMK